MACHDLFQELIIKQPVKKTYAELLFRNILEIFFLDRITFSAKICKLASFHIPRCVFSSYDRIITGRYIDISCRVFFINETMLQRGNKQLYFPAEKFCLTYFSILKTNIAIKQCPRPNESIPYVRGELQTLIKHLERGKQRE